MITRRAPTILVLLTLATCDADESDGAAACEPSEAPATVTVDNRSGLLVEGISATACDGGDEQELTLPAEGIAFASQATIELPGPGCWLLQWDGEGCRNEAPYRTSADVCAGETYDWTISVDGRVCQTGW